MYRSFTKVFVAHLPESVEVIAYYTLAAASIAIPDLPGQDPLRRSPYPQIPALLIGRFAVRRNLQRQGIGGHMFRDAVQRALNADIAVAAIVVDPVNEPERDYWIQKRGLHPLGKHERRLYVSMKEIRRVVMLSKGLDPGATAVGPG